MGNNMRTDTLPKFIALPLSANSSNSLGISAVFSSSLPIFDPFELSGGGLIELSNVGCVKRTRADAPGLLRNSVRHFDALGDAHKLTLCPALLRQTGGSGPPRCKFGNRRRRSCKG